MLNLLDVLAGHVRERGDQLALAVLRDGSEVVDHWSFAELDRRATAVAVELQSLGLAGQRAILL